jgi:integrase/predicted RNA-binding Zn-ribbon protein involved in translation (DUF1610 family)
MLKVFKLRNKSKKLLCPECKSSQIWKDGIRQTRNDSVQRYICRLCGFRFSESSTNHQVKVNIAGKLLEKPDSGKNFSEANITQADLSFQASLDDLSLQRGEDVGSHSRSDVTIAEKRLNSFRCFKNDRQKSDESKRRVYVSLATGTRNLAEVESRTEKRAAGATEQADVKGKIIEFLWHLEKQGKSKDTIINRKYMLGTLLKLGANLFDPESVKDVIAKNPKWKSPNTKAQAVTCYKCFARFLRLDWEPPKYAIPDSLPFIPLEKELDTLIHGSGRFLGAFLQGLKDTGADPGELAALRWIDVNPQSKTVAINHPVKGHNARILKVSDEFLARINRIPKVGERVFSNVRSILSNFTTQRRRIAHAYGNPRLLKITLRTFRHWKGTIEYHKTHDVYHVKKILGHKRLRSTEIYINLEQAVFAEQSDEFHVKTVNTLEEACKLLEVGFEYVTDMDGYKLFRKRK